MKKKNLFIFSLSVVSALTLGAIYSSALDPFTNSIRKVESQLESNKQLQDKVLVEIGDTKVTNVELANLKANKLVEANPVIDESTLLKEIVVDKLFLELADDEGVTATYEEGIKEAEKMRALLATQSIEVQDTQKNFIELRGLTEEEYWTVYAPSEYQEQLTLQNLGQLLIKQGKIGVDKDSNTNLGQDLIKFKEHLLTDALSKGDVKIVDDSINF
ncbi:hypothetical protein [Paenibacillus gallinarum]|uniref:Uncharacterized protein n=1 Tax=Paenibacillus gallinarum TaxID=2762232 RepID=A0ABR8T1G8_9BACL|nr:hypothetical protein [Paenibacillus gallinarum]MBD7969593.1 hypothetical protein [Paenibacillus gallinarum]